ncbi:hypothetical protein C0Q70_18697 [Pomacea canaliculata]|uniref:Beta-catenin-like protein 1 n=1 Tax=Pomacea canaliculata TaxID=400727 RepID=A0A2T7NH95_POMCA|nr:hypothetical protein C0Q70_18697 [Pomacea canaliculata]
MDVGELLSYKPDKPEVIVKRRQEEEDGEPAIKKRKGGNPVAPLSLPLQEENEQDTAVQNTDEVEAGPMDETNVKKMLLQFEKKAYRNQEMRIKFPDLPEKFMESELELNDIIQQMHVIATVPELYHILVELNTVRSFLQLLSHDNTDIAIAVVDLMQELTDVDTLNESEENATALIDAMLEGQVTAMLVQNLERLDESVKEESDGVHNTLAIIENIAEFRPEICGEAAQQGLLQWLLKRIKGEKIITELCYKVLNHAMTGVDGVDNSQKFVDILGLRTIFPLFMKTPKSSKAGPASDELEEHICSIIGSLLRHCHGTQRQRLLSKFTENDHEKVERLMELHFKYLDKVRHCDDQIEREKMRLKQQGEDVDDDMEDEFYLKRLDSGLFTLQLIDYIMLEVCASGASSIKSRVMQILNMRGGSIKVIRGIMREYAGNIGDAKDSAAREAEQSRIIQLVDKF